MEREAHSRREGLNSSISRSFSGLLGCYSSISQGHRSRLGEAEDEEGKDSVEEEDSEETEVEAAFPDAPEASEATSLSHSNQPLVSQAEPNFLKMMEKMTEFTVQLTQAVFPRGNSRLSQCRHLILLIILKPIN
ncbi:hypothetical protein O181_083320 [Austropuccinia psidii MF-1]|uniref:Uncharacterized protein n=1 Tax=Austropuccinia psidii MF-1 TaxID=1389203 RepID=A0A9Q3FTI9_9BASI|nr:hypothetical protein [Austropuccinia psidii MF-1]